MKRSLIHIFAQIILAIGLGGPLRADNAQFGKVGCANPPSAFSKHAALLRQFLMLRDLDAPVALVLREVGENKLPETRTTHVRLMKFDISKGITYIDLTDNKARTKELNSILGFKKAETSELFTNSLEANRLMKDADREINARPVSNAEVLPIEKQPSVVVDQIQIRRPGREVSGEVKINEVSKERALAAEPSVVVDGSKIGSESVPKFLKDAYSQRPEAAAETYLPNTPVNSSGVSLIPSEIEEVIIFAGPKNRKMPIRGFVVESDRPGYIRILKTAIPNSDAARAGEMSFGGYAYIHQDKLLRRQDLVLKSEQVKNLANSGERQVTFTTFEGLKKVTKTVRGYFLPSSNRGGRVDLVYSVYNTKQRKVVVKRINLSKASIKANQEVRSIPLAKAKISDTKLFDNSVQLIPASERMITFKTIDANGKAATKTIRGYIIPPDEEAKKLGRITVLSNVYDTDRRAVFTEAVTIDPLAIVSDKDAPPLPRALIENSGKSLDGKPATGNEKIFVYDSQNEVGVPQRIVLRGKLKSGENNEDGIIRFISAYDKAEVVVPKEKVVSLTDFDGRLDPARIEDSATRIVKREASGETPVRLKTINEIQAEQRASKVQPEDSSSEISQVEAVEDGDLVVGSTEAIGDKAGPEDLTPAPKIDHNPNLAFARAQRESLELRARAVSPSPEKIPKVALEEGSSSVPRVEIPSEKMEEILDGAAADVSLDLRSSKSVKGNGLDNLSAAIEDGSGWFNESPEQRGDVVLSEIGPAIKDSVSPMHNRGPPPVPKQNTVQDLFKEKIGAIQKEKELRAARIVHKDKPTADRFGDSIRGLINSTPGEPGLSLLQQDSLSPVNPHSFPSWLGKNPAEAKTKFIEVVTRHQAIVRKIENDFFNNRITALQMIDKMQRAQYEFVKEVYAGGKNENISFIGAGGFQYAYRVNTPKGSTIVKMRQYEKRLMYLAELEEMLISKINRVRERYNNNEDLRNEGITRKMPWTEVERKLRSKYTPAPEDFAMGAEFDAAILKYLGQRVKKESEENSVLGYIGVDNTLKSEPWEASLGLVTQREIGEYTVSQFCIKYPQTCEKWPMEAMYQGMMPVREDPHLMAAYMDYFGGVRQNAEYLFLPGSHDPAYKFMTPIGSDFKWSNVLVEEKDFGALPCPANSLPGSAQGKCVFLIWNDG